MKITITPSNSCIRVGGIDVDIKEELKSLQHATQDIQGFIRNLRKPTYPNGKPSLSLHDLDKCDGEKIQQVFEAISPMYVIITSLNFLSHAAAGVFATHLDRVKPGASSCRGSRCKSRDLHNALVLVDSYQEWVRDLYDVPFEKRTTQNSLNAHIATRAFRRVANSGFPAFSGRCDSPWQVLAGEA